MTLWQMDAGGEQTAYTEPRLVIADGDVFATVTGMWSDVDGVRVSIDWAAKTCFGAFTRLEDMSGAEALALADALRSVAALPPPQQAQ